MLQELIQVFIEQFDFFIHAFFTHIKISFISVYFASVLGIGLGLWISKHKKYAQGVISAVSLLYTIPSIALLGFLISISGIGNTTAIIALTLYGLLPMVRSTYTGLLEVDPVLIEAARGMGSDEKQILKNVKIPLAFPFIFSAFRNMTTMTIALAGIASFVGAGGLGVAIYRGITTNNVMMIYIGSILVAALAILTDGCLQLLETYFITYRKRGLAFIRYSFRFAWIVVVLVLFPYEYHSNVIKIAGKPTTEGYILAELVSITIEEHTDLKVKLTHGIGGGTGNIHPAMVKGDFDIYSDYTGTIWQVVLKEEEPYNERRFYELNTKYLMEYGLMFKGLYGFNNTYGLAVHKEIADRYQLKTYSDLAKFSNQLIFGAEYDFYQREDGFNALKDAYHFQFKKVVDLDNGLKYQAMANKQIDVMTIFTTDGMLTSSDVVVLEDDLMFYPSYLAGSVIRQATLEEYPQLEDVLLLLENRISDQEMAQMNYEVEVLNKKPSEVAYAFLKEKGLLKK